MTKMTGGQAAIESLKAEKVEHVFGLIGSATMEMFDALYDAKEINFVGVHDERTGTHMADGYARASGKTGVILAGQNGPGATNLVTGLGQAMAAFSPVVSIAGALSSRPCLSRRISGGGSAGTLSADHQEDLDSDRHRARAGDVSRGISGGQHPSQGPRASKLASRCALGEC